MIPIAKPVIGEEEKQAVLEVLSSGVIAQGPKVKEFEEKFADFIGTKYAIAVNSGTAALHVALLAQGIKCGDEIITTPFTFISTANSILFCNVKPVFVDIEEDYFNINPDLIQEKINKETKAILPVHLYGHPADMKLIMDIAEDNNLFVIEDACQAVGAEFDGRKVGSFATGCFSFYPTKNMTTSEGGMITTNDEKVAEKARMIRDHGSKKKYHHDILGYNFRMTDIEAALGIAQLGKLPLFTKKRIENAGYLTNKLKSLTGIITPKVKQNCKHVFHQYTVRITEKNRDEVSKYLNEQGIGTGIHYPIPIHKQDFYISLGYNDNLPVAERMSKEVLSLPVHPSVSNKDLDYITQKIGDIFINEQT